MLKRIATGALWTIVVLCSGAFMVLASISLDERREAEAERVAALAYQTPPGGGLAAR